MKNILVPVGNPESAQETLQYAVQFAAAFDAQIYVMEVLTIGYVSEDLGKLREKFVESSQDRMRELISRIDQGGVNIKIATYTGDIIDGLQEL